MCQIVLTNDRRPVPACPDCAELLGKTMRRPPARTKPGSWAKFTVRPLAQTVPSSWAKLPCTRLPGVVPAVGPVPAAGVVPAVGAVPAAGVVPAVGPMALPAAGVVPVPAVGAMPAAGVVALEANCNVTMKIYVALGTPWMPALSYVAWRGGHPLSAGASLRVVLSGKASLPRVGRDTAGVAERNVWLNVWAHNLHIALNIRRPENHRTT